MTTNRKARQQQSDRPEPETWNRREAGGRPGLAAIEALEQTVESLPETAVVEKRGDGRLIVQVPAAEMAGFFEWAAARTVNVQSCALRKTSLEEAFFKALEEES